MKNINLRYAKWDVETQNSGKRPTYIKSKKTLVFREFAIDLERR